MPQRGVEHAALALVASPSHSKVLVGAVHAVALQVHRLGIQPQQAMVARALVGFLELIDLIHDAEGRTEVLRRRMLGVLDQDGHIFVPRMIVEVTAEHAAKAFVAVERIGSTMRANEGTSGLDPSEQRITTLKRQRQLARGVEEHTLVGRQIRGIELRGVAAGYCRVEAGCTAAFVQHALDQTPLVRTRPARYFVLKARRQRVDQDARGLHRVRRNRQR